MQHFVCKGGCGGVSQEAGVCQASTCSLHGHPLSACDCADGMHTEVLKKCEKCGKLCDGNCDVEPFKPELNN